MQRKPALSSKLIEAIANPIFPELDTQLRAGRHICSEDMEKHSFIYEYFRELDSFYRRYNVELVQAPEDFYYLRTKSTSIIASSQLTELEMLAGKILCLLYLSPERLAQQGIFSVQEVYDELISLVEIERLVKLINPRSTGSDIDKAKLMDKLRSSLGRLSRIGVISYLPRDKERNLFVVRSACFRFGADVRNGENPLEAQEKLVRSGEAVTAESLELANQATEANAEEQALLNKIDSNSTINSNANDNINSLACIDIDRTTQQIDDSSNYVNNQDQDQENLQYSNYYDEDDEDPFAGLDDENFDDEYEEELEDLDDEEELELLNQLSEFPTPQPRNTNTKDFFDEEE